MGGEPISVARGNQMTLARSVQISKRCGRYPCNCSLAPPIQTFYSLMRKGIRRNKTGVYTQFPLCSTVFKSERARNYHAGHPSLRGLLSPLYCCQNRCRDTSQDIAPNPIRLFLHMEMQRRRRSRCLERHIPPKFLQKRSPKHGCREYEIH